MPEYYKACGSIKILGIRGVRFSELVRQIYLLAHRP